MERRSTSMGCIVAGLGLVLAGCLMPYLISSVYSVASTLLQQSAPTKWLFGDWLSTVLEPSGTAYRLLVELPICCVGAVSLLVIILGVVWMIRRRDEGDEDEFLAEDEGEYDLYSGPETEDGDAGPTTW